MEGQYPVATPAEAADIREQDKALAVRLSRSDRAPHEAELLQLAAIYAALPEPRRRSWFERLGACGVSPAMRDRIAERAGRLIRFPDWHNGEQLRMEQERKRQRALVRQKRRRTSDI